MPVCTDTSLEATCACVLAQKRGGGRGEKGAKGRGREGDREREKEARRDSRTGILRRARHLSGVRNTQSADSPSLPMSCRLTVSRSDARMSSDMLMVTFGKLALAVLLLIRP